MHAYLIIGIDSENLKAESEELAKKLKAKILEFPIAKIEDMRNLNNLIRLSFNEPTLIVCENIHEAGEEALNAFLKNLEEPQDNIYFALTAPTARKVLPTIVSRCQVVKVKSEKRITGSAEKAKNEEVEQFFNFSTSQRLLFFDKIRDRSEAIRFVTGLIFYLHEKREMANMELLIKTLNRLKANGNISLQLSNLAIQYA